MDKKRIFTLLGLSIIVGLILSSFASGHPDGLEKVAEDHGFIGSAFSFWDGLLPDYTFSGVGNEFLSVGLAGLIGTAVTFILLYGVSFALAKVKNK